MKKIPVWKNVILIVSVLFVIIIATLAWFYNGKEADADEFVVRVGKATYVQVSGDSGNNWSEDLDLEIGINDNFKEISGDGMILYAPVYEVVQDDITGRFDTELVSFEQVGEGEYYYEQILDFRADTMQNIYLSHESLVTAQDGGYIDGAIRVAFFEIDGNGNETLKFIWAPNSTVEYSVQTDSFNREGKVEPYYCYQTSRVAVDPEALETSNSGLVKIYTDGTDELGCGYDPTHRFMWSNGQNLPADAPSILTLDTLGGDDHFCKTMKVKVWLEGHDRECVSLLSGQKFTLKLEFDAQEVE